MNGLADPDRRGIARELLLLLELLDDVLDYSDAHEPREAAAIRFQRLCLMLDRKQVNVLNCSEDEISALHLMRESMLDHLVVRDMGETVRPRDQIFFATELTEPWSKQEFTEEQYASNLWHPKQSFARVESAALELLCFLLPNELTWHSRDAIETALDCDRCDFEETALPGDAWHPEDSGPEADFLYRENDRCMKWAKGELELDDDGGNDLNAEASVSVAANAKVRPAIRTLARARDLLLTTDMNLPAIAKKLGVKKQYLYANAEIRALGIKVSRVRPRRDKLKLQSLRSAVTLEGDSVVARSSDFDRTSAIIDYREIIEKTKKAPSEELPSLVAQIKRMQEEWKQANGTDDLEQAAASK